MKPRAYAWVTVGLLVVAMLTWAVPESSGAATGQSGSSLQPAQESQKVTGYFKRLNTKRTPWTITIQGGRDGRPTISTYTLAGDVSLRYRGEYVPWQGGVGTNSIVELILEKGEVKVINVLHDGS